ncbi:MAG: hypothetical protein OSB15_09430 [Amylibacter sp.]|nr:hypothetical protein [Amylibacter sp.]
MSLRFSGQTGTFADRNVASGIAVTVSGVRLEDGAGGLASNDSLI